MSAAPSRSCPYYRHNPIGARALPASRVQKIIPIRPALGVLPVSHGRTAHYLSSWALQPYLRHKSGRPVVGRIAGPYRRCHLIERVAGRTRAGHVHAERIADCTILAGAALCASGLAPCGASWAGTVVPDRQRRAAATPRGYRVERGQPVCHASHQSHHLGGLASLCHHRRGHPRPSQVPARRSGRLGPITGRAGTGRPAHCHPPTAPPVATWPTRPLACSPPHAAAVTRRQLGCRPGATGRPAPGGQYPRYDSDARGLGPRAPRHQVATHDGARARSRQLPVSV